MPRSTRPVRPAPRALLLAATLATTPLAAQDTIPPPPAQDTLPATTFTLTGQIVDALNEAPVVSAVLKAPELRRYVFSDVNGRFRFADFPEGTWEIVVEMLGYHTLDGSVTVAEGNGLLLRLNPDPIALEELAVRSRADGLLERRRRRYPFRVTNISTRTIADAIHRDPAAIFRRNAMSYVTSCSNSLGEWVLGGCYVRRGGTIPVKVFLDEGVLVGGMGELSLFPVDDIHSMDWVKDIGELHVYTKWFMKRLNSSSTRLMPFRWPFDDL